jgi:hypothetical protein
MRRARRKTGPASEPAPAAAEPGAEAGTESAETEPAGQA